MDPDPSTVLQSTSNESFVLDMLILGFSLFASGIFSSSETALTALPESKVRQLIDTHPRRFASLKLWLEKPNQILTTILIGNNIVNVFLSTYAGLVTQRFFKDNVLAVAVTLTTAALLVLGEITPKTFAKQHAQRMAPVLMHVVKATYYILFPFVYCFSFLSKVLVRFFGGDADRGGPFVTEEYINYMLKEGEKAGTIEESESELITNIFEFGDTIVRQVMVPRTDVVALSVNASVDDIRAQVSEGGHTRMPVHGEKGLDDIHGFFHSRELIGHLNEDEFKLTDKIHKPFWVSELMKISELLKEFQQRKLHLCVVHDEHGSMSGIVSLEDILEEIVGEIHDEYDDERDDLRKLNEDKFIAEGKANLDEIEDAIEIAFPHPRAYETLGGFLTTQLGRMPKLGTRVQYEGWLFVVSEMQARRVEKVEIERLQPTLVPTEVNTQRKA